MGKNLLITFTIILCYAKSFAQIDTMYNTALTRTVCVDSVCKELRCDHGLDLHTFEIWNGDFGGFTMKNKTNGFYLGSVGIQLTLYTEENKMWKNGKFSIFMIDTYGNNPSTNYIHDTQYFDNMEAPPTNHITISKNNKFEFRNFIYCFYYEHTFKNFKILAGQYDINYDFANSNTGFNFINSSFGVSPAITVNVPSFSTYPFTALALRGEYHKNKFYFRSAITEGSGGNQTINLHGDSYSFTEGEGVMAMNEAEIRNVKNDVWKSSIKLGMWNHTGNIFYDLTTTDSLGNHPNVKGNNGLYLIADKVLFFEKQDSGQYLSGFFTADFVPGKQNFYNYSIGGGLAYTGLFKKRPEDVLAIGAFCPFVNQKLVREQGFAKNEIEAEINYNIKVNAFINLQPSFQYIYQPGAVLGSYNPVAFLLRCTVRNGLFN